MMRTAHCGFAVRNGSSEVVPRASLFPPWSNTLFAMGLSGLVLGPLIAVAAMLAYVRTPFHTRMGFPVIQPVQVDHRHHVADDGIDCRYCHSTVGSSPSAGIPATSVCMGCHAQVWNLSPRLEPVRASFFGGQPIAFNRVYQLPDFVFFNHSIHVNKGVGCVSCHGRVDQMALVTQQQALTMQWCLDCHRSPEQHLRPLDQITNMAWQPGGDRTELGRKLKEAYQVQSRTDCYTCHR